MGSIPSSDSRHHGSTDHVPPSPRSRPMTNPSALLSVSPQESHCTRAPAVFHSRPFFFFVAGNSRIFWSHCCPRILPHLNWLRLITGESYNWLASLFEPWVRFFWQWITIPVMNPLSLVFHYPTRFFVTGRFLSIPQSTRLRDGDGGWPLCRCHAQAPQPRPSHPSNIHTVTARFLPEEPLK